MQLLFADRLPEQALDALRAQGHVCVMEPSLTADELPGAIAGFDGLVVRSTRVGRPAFEAADRLALVIRAGSGTDTIDVAAASDHGVAVCNVPGRNAAAVAELTLGLLLAVDRRIADNVADLREGRWDKKRYSGAAGLLGSTMAIIGLGSVGFAVAERAAAFGIHLQALAKPDRPPEAVARAGHLGIALRASLPELLASADIVTVHVPASPDTRHLVDSAFLDQMKEGAILLNTSRGDMVDDQALLRALDAGRVRAGLDVFADEPAAGTASWDSPLARHPGVVATHHIGASTGQAQRAIAEGVIEAVDGFVAGQLRHCVNLDHVLHDGAPDHGLGAEAGRPAAVVRPFPARVVRQDRAPGTVTAMFDPMDENGSDPPGPADPTAYDDSPAALYVYRQQEGGASYTGVVCELDIRAFADGQVRGHEAVHRPRVEAILRYHATTDAPPALVALLHHAGPVFRSSLDDATQAPPILDFPGPGGRRQTVWRVPDGAATAAVTGELAIATHYVADGHHRVAAALEEWQQGGRSTGAGVLCVVHPLDGLRLAAFHRRVSGPVDPAQLRDLLTRDFRVSEAPGPPVPASGSFGLYVAGRWHQLSYLGEREEGPAGLDAAILQARVLDEVAGAPASDVAAVRSTVDELTRQCDCDGGALFTLAPPPLEALTTLADAGGLMPAKTTYFAPKPAAGIFLRR